jgi:hypothetical protein
VKGERMKQNKNKGDRCPRERYEDSGGRKGCARTKINWQTDRGKKIRKM